MAKKKAARGDFNMSEGIRALLSNTPGMTSRQVYDALAEQYPGQKINRNSCNVAFSHARRKLGISGSSSRTARVPRPSVVRQSAAAAGVGSDLNFGLLQAARTLVAQAGSPEAAIQAIEQLQSLQIN